MSFCLNIWTISQRLGQITGLLKNKFNTNSIHNKNRCFSTDFDKKLKSFQKFNNKTIFNNSNELSLINGVSLRYSSTVGKTITCKAAVLWKEGQPLSLETITVEPPEEDQVRVKLIAAGICATDAHFVWGWNTDLAPDLEGNPMVLGHEGAAIVESVGQNVKSVSVGDKVMLMWMPECGDCALCQNPKTNSCLSGNFSTTLYINDSKETGLHVNGKPLLSFGGTAAFSEYSVLHESQVAKLDTRADLKTVCIIGCAVGTGYGSATNIARVHENSICAIWGMGPIGLSAALGCQAMKARTVIGVDLNPEKEMISRQMGCNRFVTSSEELEELIRSEGGLDYAFDCVGNQSVLDTALKCLSPWGSLVAVGLPSRGSKVDVTVEELLNGRVVTGGYFGNEKPRAFNQKLVKMHCSGELKNLEHLITKRMGLKDINKAFDDLKAGKTIRTVIEF